MNGIFGLTRTEEGSASPQGHMWRQTREWGSHFDTEIQGKIVIKERQAICTSVNMPLGMPESQITCLDSRPCLCSWCRLPTLCLGCYSLITRSSWVPDTLMGYLDWVLASYFSLSQLQMLKTFEGRPTAGRSFFPSLLLFYPPFFWPAPPSCAFQISQASRLVWKDNLRD